MSYSDQGDPTDALFSSDDFYTYNTVPFTESYTGCGGEFCPGPNPGDWTDEAWFEGTGFTAETLCSRCKRRTKTTVTGIRPRGMEG